MKAYLLELLASQGDRNTSISKLVMLIGTFTISLVVLWQAYQGDLSAEVFAWYASITVGANTANKAISVVGNKPTKKQGEPQ